VIQNNQDGTNYQIQTEQNNTNFIGGEHHHYYPAPGAIVEGTPQNLPSSGVVKFVGREQELQALHRRLQTSDQVAISATIAGMGGIGKTELAIQYSLRYQSEYSGGICWIIARDSDVGTQITDFAASELKLQSDHIGSLKGRVRYCWNNWQREGNVLVVFDDVTSYGQIKDYLPPQNSRFRVLITTRRRNLGSPVVRIELNVLNPDDAIDLLKSLIGSERVERELEVANQLCKWLGYLPLALELVGRYLVQNEARTISRLLSELQEKDSLRHDSTTATTEEMTAQRGLSAAFELSWDELSIQAQKLGCLLCLFGLAPTPFSLVERAINASDSIAYDSSTSTLQDLRESFTSGAEQSNIIAELVNLSLVIRTSEGNYRLHELIREFFQDKLNALPQAELLEQEFSGGMLEVARQIFESNSFAMSDLKTLLDFLLKVPTEGRGGSTLLDFLELLSQYYIFQQYIYDTGYLESAIDKLEQAKAYLKQLGDSNNLKAKVIASKMLGHAYYANPGQTRSQAIENMMTARLIAARADRVATSEIDHQMWLWYQVFLLDHVHNLLSKPSDQPSDLIPEELEIEIAELLPTSLEQADTAPELEVLPSLLRAAHYWGHRGNQVSIKLENLLRELPSNTQSEEVELLIDQGINFYSLAAIFRSANFRLSFPQQYQRHLASILNEIPGIPGWLLTWNPDIGLIEFEKFTSSSQAIGDIAHQYRGMVTVQLYGYLYDISRRLGHLEKLTIRARYAIVKV
jgi:hypothetical protein